MDTIPKRSTLAKVLYRNLLDKYESKLVFPVKDPNFYQIVGLLLSGVFLFKPHPVLGIILIVIILLSDWMDGAVARRYKKTSREGWMIDVVVDRISEGLMFVAYLGTFVGNIFFFLYLLNILGSYYSVKTGKQTILALRFFYLIYLLIIAVQ
jgi:phosphatidylglycerophosphate synthase